MADCTSPSGKATFSTRRRSKEEEREHSRRKHKRRRERAWDGLQIVLNSVPNSFFEPNRGLVLPGKVDCGWNWETVPAAVTPAANNRRADLRVQRKRDQVDGFSRILESMFDPQEPIRVVDFGCGTGNLTVPLAWKFPKWTFVGIDMKSKCIQLLNERAQQASLKNLVGCVGLVRDVELSQRFDVALALHACGSATDDALLRATESSIKAAFVVSPCCAGKMDKSISDAGHLEIAPQDFAVISSFADHATGANLENCPGESITLQRQAKNLIEADRLRYCRRQGYSAVLCQLTPDVSYPKNDVLIGVSGTLPKELLKDLLKD